MISIDFETYYSKKAGLSVATMGNYAYCTHPDFHVLLVAVHGEGIEFCGEPDKFDWSLLEGTVLLAHNVSFDKAVYDLWICRQPWFSAGRPSDWYDTADLAAWSGSERSLAKASAALLKKKMSKQIRTNMSGVTKCQAQAKGIWNDFVKYGMGDAVACTELWSKYAEGWPEKERKVSRYNRIEGERGVMINQDALEEGLTKLKTAIWEAEQQIPWNWSDNKTPLSSKQLALTCRKAGIPVPVTTNKKEDECIQWMNTYGGRFPWVSALHKWRSANSLALRLRNIQRRIRPDGSVEVSLLYFGAHTGRFTGVGGINFANMARGEICGVDVRSMLIPREGCVFHISDLAQIEPRCLAVVAGDEEFVKGCATASPYEVHARNYMGFTGGNLKKEDPSMYSLAKARVLALGYGAGWQRFLEMAPTYISPEEMDLIFLADITAKDRSGFVEYLEVQKSPRARQQLQMYKNAGENDQKRFVNSWKQVVSFRMSNKYITDLWKHFAQQLRKAAATTHRMNVRLPSGRVKQYTDILHFEGDIKGSVLFGQAPVNLYGGKITENSIQAVARDVFIEGYINLLDAGLHIPLHVYDEYVVEVPEDFPVSRTEELITRTIPWIDDLPIAVETEVSMFYKK